MPVALGGEEGRDKLRKAAVRGKCISGGRTRGTETSKYPEEEKITMIAQVVASERALAQTGAVLRPRPGL